MSLLSSNIVIDQLLKERGRRRVEYSLWSLLAVYSFAPPNVVHLITILEVRLSVRRESRAVRTDDRSNSFPFNDKPLQSNAAHTTGTLAKINAVAADRILMKVDGRRD